MKKILFIGLVAATMLAGCSNDETIEVNDTSRAIGFDGAFVDKSTRVTDITTENIDNFSVYGFVNTISGVVFNNEKVYKEEGNWKYDNLQFWIPDQKYYFTAIAPYANKQWEYQANELKGGVLTFKCKDANGQQDLLFATNFGNNNDGVHYGNGEGHITETPEAVSFSFNHLLSRVIFSFENGMTNENMKLKIVSVTVNHALTTAKIDLGKSPLTWEKGEFTSEPTYVLDFNPNTTTFITKDNTMLTEQRYMIPATQKNISVNFSVSLYSGEVLMDTYVHNGIPIENFNMEMGHSYKFKVKITPENIAPDELYPIQFTVESVEEWKNDEEKDITIPEKTTQKQTFNLPVD